MGTPTVGKRDGNIGPEHIAFHEIELIRIQQYITRINVTDATPLPPPYSKNLTQYHKISCRPDGEAIQVTTITMYFTAILLAVQCAFEPLIESLVWSYDNVR